MFPKITIEQHRSDFITGEVEVGGLIARRRDSTSLDKPLRFDNLADAFRATWEAVHELRNEPVPTLVLGPHDPGDAVELGQGIAITGTSEQIAAAKAEQDALAEEQRLREDAAYAKTLDTAPPAPKRRGRPRRNVG